MLRMRYRNAIITLGFVILFVGAIDVPVEWKKALCALSGIAVIVLGYLAGRDRRPGSSASPSAHTVTPSTSETPNTTSVGK